MMSNDNTKIQTAQTAPLVGCAGAMSQGSALARRGHNKNAKQAVFGLSYAQEKAARAAACALPPRPTRRRRSRRGGRKHRHTPKPVCEAPCLETQPQGLQLPPKTQAQTAPLAVHSTAPTDVLAWPQPGAINNGSISIDDDASAASEALAWPMADEEAASLCSDVLSESGDSRAGSTGLPATAGEFNATATAAPVMQQGMSMPTPQQLAHFMQEHVKLQQQLADIATRQQLQEQRICELETALAAATRGPVEETTQVAASEAPVVLPAEQEHEKEVPASPVTQVATDSVGQRRPLANGWLSRGKSAAAPAVSVPKSAPAVAATAHVRVGAVAVQVEERKVEEQCHSADTAAVAAAAAAEDSWDESEDEVPAVAATSKDEETKSVPEEDELGLGTALTQADHVASFDRMGISAELLRGVEALGYEKPSRVQALATKPLVDGRDTIAQAPPGQGKTGAFAIGALSHVDVSLPELQVVVVSPSKELCKQTAKVFTVLGQHLGESAAQSRRTSRFGRSRSAGARVEAFIGGVQSVGDNLRALRRKPHVVVGCSGRLCQLVREGLMDMSRVRVIVLDEADELVHGSQRFDVATIVTAAPSRAQIGLFSATMPDAATEVAREFMSKPAVMLTRGRECQNDNIRHCYVPVGSNADYTDGARSLAGYLKSNAGQSMVFVRRRSDAVDVARALYDEGVEAVDAVHSGVDREAQQHALKCFKKGSCRVLVCTDMLARGIDVPAVNTVINIGLPSELDRYVHRAGRCGRFNRRGVCISIVSERSLPRLGEIEERFGAVLAPFRG